MAELAAGALVHAEQISEVISTVLTVEQINAFINMAHVLVSTRLSNANLDIATLTQIELLLAAHFITLRDPRAKSEKIDEYSVTFQGETGSGLRASIYGQQAIELDASGILASMGKQRASIQVL